MVSLITPHSQEMSLIGAWYHAVLLLWTKFQLNDSTQTVVTLLRIVFIKTIYISWVAIACA